MTRAQARSSTTAVRVRHLALCLSVCLSPVCVCLCVLSSVCSGIDVSNDKDTGSVRSSPDAGTIVSPQMRSSLIGQPPHSHYPSALSPTQHGSTQHGSSASFTKVISLHSYVVVFYAGRPGQYGSLSGWSFLPIKCFEWLNFDVPLIKLLLKYIYILFSILTYYKQYYR